MFSKFFFFFFRWCKTPYIFHLIMQMTVISTRFGATQHFMIHATPSTPILLHPHPLLPPGIPGWTSLFATRVSLQSVAFLPLDRQRDAPEPKVHSLSAARSFPPTPPSAWVAWVTPQPCLRALEVFGYSLAFLGLSPRRVLQIFSKFFIDVKPPQAALCPLSGQVLQSSSKFFKVLQSSSNFFKVLQSSSKSFKEGLIPRINPCCAPC